MLEAAADYLERTEPQSLLLEVKAKTAEGREIRGVGGAIAGWQQIQPVAVGLDDCVFDWHSTEKYVVDGKTLWVFVDA